MDIDRPPGRSQPTRGFVVALSAAVLAIAFGLRTEGGQARAAPVVAYVARVAPAGRHLADVAVIRRGGAPLAIANDNIDLQAGDQIFLKSSQVVLLVRMIEDRLPVPVEKQSRPAGAPDYVVRQPVQPGLAEQVWNAIKAIFIGADLSDLNVPLGSRGDPEGGACFTKSEATSKPAPVRIPVFTAASSNLTPGARPLFVAWRGGAAPFSVSLELVSSGAVVVRADKINNCAVWLPTAKLVSGHYRLVVTDATGVGASQDPIIVGESAPAMPAALAQADMPSEAREIYYASWLALTDSGAWTFEAQQTVAALPCRDAEVRNWLLKWARTPVCLRAPTGA